MIKKETVIVLCVLVLFLCGCVCGDGSKLQGDCPSFETTEKGEVKSGGVFYVKEVRISKLGAGTAVYDLKYELTPTEASHALYNRMFFVTRRGCYRG